MLRRGEIGRPGGGRLSRTAVRIILDLLYLMATPPIVLWLLLPSRFFTRRRYRSGLLQKLGGSPLRGGEGPCLWIHAVSVGEVRTALPLIERLREALPGWDLRVSTSTDTGMDLARRSLPPSIEAFYYPIDYGWAVRRALRRIRPAAVILLELELWPNFLLGAEGAGIPVLVANGRISERSFPRYRRLGFLSRWLFRRVRAFAVQEEEYARRFEALGVAREKIEVLGNLKYDVTPREFQGSTFAMLRWPEEPGPDRGLILVGGCTHPGEEEILLGIWGRARERVPRLKMILAPRHIERVEEIERRIEALSGISPLLWSRAREGRAPEGENPLVLVDSIGELDRFYRIADVAFVGGSLADRGGHNLLEPARLGKPVLFGPSISNFGEIARHLLAGRAALQVPDPEALERETVRLLLDPEEREALSRRARETAETLTGAAVRHLDWILRWVPGAAGEPSIPEERISR